MKVAATTANKQNQTSAVANNVSKQKNNSPDDSGFVDNRPETKALKSLQMMINDSPRMDAQRQRTSNITGGPAQLVEGPGANVPNGPAESSEIIRLYAPSQVSKSKSIHKNGNTQVKIRCIEGETNIDTQPIQKLSLYHGTTTNYAVDIVRKIDPSKGKGEFGAGFYTVFDEDQAKHISMYYWDKEEKWKNDGGVAVVKTTLKDDLWKKLISEGGVDDKGEKYKAIYKTRDEWYRERFMGGEEEEVEGEEGEEEEEEVEEVEEGVVDEEEVEEVEVEVEEVEEEEGEEEEGEGEVEEIALPSAKGSITREWEYRQDKGKMDPLDKPVEIGPIKDPKTPYLQVVFADDIGGWLNKNSTRKSIWEEKHRGPINNYEETEELAMMGLGSMVFEKGSEEAIEIFKQKAFEEGPRATRLQTYFGGFQDRYVPEEVTEWLKGVKKVPGQDHGDILLSYVQGKEE
jgi:hypothetical protein